MMTVDDVFAFYFKVLPYAAIFDALTLVAIALMWRHRSRVKMFFWRLFHPRMARRLGLR